jgi:hypothetical protein
MGHHARDASDKASEIPHQKNAENTGAPCRVEGLNGRKPSNRTVSSYLILLVGLGGDLNAGPPVPKAKPQ